MLCALIMAGGKGTRFWPLSTEEKPKQFLNLIGKETMIQMTVNRIKDIIPVERIFVCTGEMYLDLVKEQLPELPERNIIVEPIGRNTTPCIALSAFIIKRYFKDANMLVLPSDHLIRNEEEFRNIVISANEFINKNNKAIVTLGMQPTRPETQYGYIKCGEFKELSINHNINKVDAFVEKPDRNVAEKYLKEGSYFWNSGVFMWSVSNIIEEIKEHSIETYEALNKVYEVSDEVLQGYINSQYSKTEAISIDYAVLEKSPNIYVIKSNIGWDDIGSWEAVERFGTKDSKGNICFGNVDSLDAGNNLIVASNNRIIINGLSNIYVVENDGQIIIGQKSKVNEIKELKNII
ncbi:mannose-1-phosphate guanylyltransferase [uncultured Clostridium sp.]|uniref:mannose-1-phosphate guanylyltransferase n=1 Tax=uncultured Clostridium sp. TaxID=59620 RepID=UPI002600339C|nr:mannose-1-phosphate guanylyltransferase [uncultured Clostridium sp.]